MAGSYYRYKRLKRYSKRNTFSPYILFMLLSSCVIVMSIGYASLTSFLTIQGNVNAQYATYTITYDTRGGTNPNNAVTQFNWGDNIPLPIPTRTDYNFEGWYDEDNDQLVTSTNGINKDLSVYATWSQAVLPTDIFVTLYTDGTLAFDNTNATIPGKL